jgi:hypothetical protein
MNEYLSAELNTVFSLPIITMAMATCEDTSMSEQLHREFTGVRLSNCTESYWKVCTKNFHAQMLSYCSINS